MTVTSNSNTAAPSATGSSSGTSLADIHPSGDALLTSLMAVPSALGQLVAAYPGRSAADGTAWVDEWFGRQTKTGYEQLLAGQRPIASDPPDRHSVSTEGIGDLLPPEVLGSLVASPSPVATREVRLLTVQPHYFRGFRSLASPISLEGRLVVLYGPNSSGKTSLSEALEWLFSGALARRGTPDHARELERCIGNQFCPSGERTWVEATFELAPEVSIREAYEPRINSSNAPERERITLRRVLLSDYGATQTSSCVSRLYRNGVELSATDERELLGTLFGGEPPLLMQHTLRSFVHSTPSARRGYFERLLRLDELTHLIEKAVVTNARLPEFAPPTGGVAYRRWATLKVAATSPGSKTAFRVADRARGGAVLAALRKCVLAVATAEFPSLVPVGEELPAALRAVEEEQKRVRQQQFPYLAKLRPKRAVDEAAMTSLDVDKLHRSAESYLEAVATLDVARVAAADIGESQLVIAQAFALLAGKGLIDEDAAIQVCPVCAQDAPPSLIAERLRTIRSWTPVAEAVDRAEKAVNLAADELTSLLRAALRTANELLPAAPLLDEWEPALAAAAESVVTAAEAARALLVDEDLAVTRAQITSLGIALKSSPLASETAQQVTSTFAGLSPGFTNLVSVARRYSASFVALENAVGTHTTGNAGYSLRATWLETAADLELTANEFQWEHAKLRTQKTLEAIRDELKRARQRLLEARRVAFTDGMTSVWNTLRNDTYSRFKELSIPEPTAKGYPVEIQVKATLDANGTTAEVDALRVFSESQVNVLGIAAFVTRSKLLGHRMVIFDDPVQSMDEDHFRTFARGLLQHLLAEGFQVVLLTHNSTFESDLSFVHSDLNEYVTLTVRHSKRTGCVVDEGNRRVQERLDRAERRADDGNLDSAWLDVRLALERLYKIVRLKHGADGFDVRTWASHTAENMWEEGVGALITARVPDAGARLKDILQLTAAGAHDKPVRGATDLRDAINYVRRLLSPLRVGG